MHNNLIDAYFFILAYLISMQIMLLLVLISYPGMWATIREYIMLQCFKKLSKNHICITHKS
jgi:hypothetical protein